MILITTSHRPSYRTRSFIKDLVSIIPGAIKVNRGHMSLEELAIQAGLMNAKYVLLVTEKKGGPGGIVINRVDSEGYRKYRFTKLAVLLIKGVKLSRENPESSRAYNVSRVSIDSSKCISDECFYLADLLAKILDKYLASEGELKIALEESKYIYLKALNVHDRPVGPVISIMKVIKFREEQ